MSLLEEIQTDILGSASISSILRKAKVLAYRLKSQGFKDWIENELGGYIRKDMAVPEYRKLSSFSYGTFRNMARQISNVQIPDGVFDGFSDDLRKMIGVIEMRQGVRALESMIDRAVDSDSKGMFKLPWPTELAVTLSNRVYEGMYCVEAWRVISKDQVAQILDDIRNRLLSFIFELAGRYPEASESDFYTLPPKATEQATAIFNFYVMGDNSQVLGVANSPVQEGAMSVFDQRNQNVQYQFNAAGNINLNSVSNRQELIGELEKLKQEVKKALAAQAIDEERATDVEYKLTKAVQQSQKSSPDKKSIIENLTEAKTLIEGITSAAGLVSALIQAAELVQKFF